MLLAEEVVLCRLLGHLSSRCRLIMNRLLAGEAGALLRSCELEHVRGLLATVMDIERVLSCGGPDWVARRLRRVWQWLVRGQNRLLLRLVTAEVRNGEVDGLRFDLVNDARLRLYSGSCSIVLRHYCCCSSLVNNLYFLQTVVDIDIDGIDGRCRLYWVLF